MHCFRMILAHTSVYWQLRQWLGSFISSRVVMAPPLEAWFDSFRVLRQSFCGKFKIICGFSEPAEPAFWMYAPTLLA